MTNMRKIFPAILVLATLVSTSPSFAFQGTKQDQQACTGDVTSLCMSAVGSLVNPNVPAITACLKANISKLSAPCRAVMSRPTPKH